MAHSVHTNDPVSFLNEQLSSALNVVAHLKTRSMLPVNPSLGLNGNSRTRWMEKWTDGTEKILAYYSGNAKR